MTLISGIYAIINFLIVAGSFGAGSLGLCCLWPGFYYGPVVGIMAIIKGSALLGQNAHNETAPKAIAIMQIVDIINLDVPCCIMGILTLVFLNEPEVSGFYRAADSTNG